MCRLKIARGVIVSKLFIRVNASDSSYMPERVIVLGYYTSTGRQHTLKETTIPSYVFDVCFHCTLFWYVTEMTTSRRTLSPISSLI